MFDRQPIEITTKQAIFLLQDDLWAIGFILFLLIILCTLFLNHKNNLNKKDTDEKNLKNFNALIFSINNKNTTQ